MKKMVSDQAQMNSEVSETEVFFSVLTAQHFFLHRPLQYSLKVLSEMESIKISINLAY